MKKRTYADFFQHIHRKAEEKGFPLRVMFELTYACNFNCRHCYVPPSYKKRYNQRELKTKEVFSILRQLKEIGCFYLGFTGGEPFLRKDIIEILKYCRQCGLQVILYTNGSLISDSLATELAALGLNKVDITIPAMTKDVFEAITGVPGSRDKVFRAIEALRKRGVNLGFKSCILKENKAQISQIQAFARSQKAFYRLSSVLGRKWPSAYCDFARGSFCLKCGAGKMQAAITPAGELKRCLMLGYPKYRILKSSLIECWKKLN